MRRGLVRFSVTLFLTLFWASESYAAVDSYRYLHVTVETPWTIFLFLLVGVMAPFVLMGLLVWRFAGRKSKPEEGKE
ncbi:MAG: hypothetical protein GC139_04405 [Sideroxydans sp.]|nr:hypothetical protein [Sideroxydans sp.]